MKEAVAGGLLDRVRSAFHEGDADAPAKVAEAGNVDCVQQMFQAIAANDFTTFADLLHDDVELEILGPPSVPFLGRWQGRREVSDAVRGNFGQVKDQRPEINKLVPQGDTVVVFLREQGRYRSTNQEYDLHAVLLYTFRGRKVAHVHELIADAWATG